MKYFNHLWALTKIIIFNFQNRKMRIFFQCKTNACVVGKAFQITFTQYPTQMGPLLMKTIFHNITNAHWKIHKTSQCAYGDFLWVIKLFSDKSSLFCHLMSVPSFVSYHVLPFQASEKVLDEKNVKNHCKRS